MKRFTTAVILLMLFAAGLILLFSLKSKPIDSLLHAPVRDDQSAQIWQVFEKAAGRNYTLKTPTDGDHRSALIHVDLDGDSKEEILAFYSKEGASETVFLQIFGAEDNGWIALAGAESGFNEVKQVEFADINGDGMLEIIIGWGLQSSKLIQQLNIYTVDIEKAEIKSIFLTKYSVFGVFDLNADGKSELAVIYGDKSAASALSVLKVFSCTSGKVSQAVSLDVDPVISTVSKISFDYLRRTNESRVYIDGFTADGQMTTDMMCFDIEKSGLERVFIDGKTVSGISKRSSNVECEDINGDGVIEIPTQKKLEHKELSSSVIEWKAVLGEKLSGTSSYFDNRENGYYFEIPKQLEKNTIPVLLSDGETMRLYLIDKDADGSLQNVPLFEIRLESEEMHSVLSGRFRPLGSYKGKKYYYRIFEAGDKLGITKKDISSGIIYN